jgi:hypothetical protein
MILQTSRGPDTHNDKVCASVASDVEDPVNYRTYSRDEFRTGRQNILLSDEISKPGASRSSHCWSLFGIAESFF